MEFCPQCKSIMLPTGGMWKCKKCGFEKERDKNSHLVSQQKRREKETVVLEKESEGLPTTQVKCQECGNNQAYWWMRQLRSADESEVRFFRCTKCGNTWREYN